MPKPLVCRDIVRIVYPLYTKAGIFTGLYTATNYDEYKHNKIKMYRGEPEYYAEYLKNKSDKYKHISKMPKLVEDGPDFTQSWKYSYSKPIIKRETNTIENYVTHLWLSK